jgi:hypothetical protein
VRFLADAVDEAERLVPGNHGKADGKDAGELFAVRSADAAGFYPQQCRVGTDLGQRKPALLERARRRLHHRTSCMLRV